MKIDKNSYNIPIVEVSTAITSGTKTEIGTAADFDTIVNMIEKSGLMIIKCTFGGNPMKGSVLANYYTNDDDIYGIDFGGVTNFGGSPSAIAGSGTLENGKFYVTMTMTSLAANRTTTSTKSSKTS